MSPTRFPTTISRVLASISLLSLGLTASSMAVAQTLQDTTTKFVILKGLLTKSTSPRNLDTTYSYDALNRLVQETALGVPVVKYEYDGLGQLVKVTDARNVVTAYTIDGLGNLLQTTSGDTGKTVNTYDEAGNLTSREDAKQQKTTFTYDEINRVKLITYHDSSTVTYEYDQGANATGKLSKITDIGGVVDYGYDLFGRVATDTRTIGGKAYTTSYRYDSANRLAGMSYPSGRAIDYGRDALGRIVSVTTTAGTAVAPLITSVDYEAFGPIKSLAFGNGQTQTRSYDLDGRMASYTLSAQTKAIGYNPSSGITSIADTANPATALTFAYDLQERLTDVAGAGFAQKYKYDGVGNRAEKTNNGAVTSYSYGTDNNRLTKVGSQPIVTDPNGSITDKVGATFNYDARGRMVSANTAIGLVTYTINSLGQRVRKVTPTETTVFHYDLGGKLIAESITAGDKTTHQEYVYLGDMPVAVIK